MAQVGSETEEYRPAAIPGWIAGAMLILGVLPFQYWYFSLLRWVVLIAAICVCWIAFGLQKPGWGVAFIVVAIAFNPIVPFTADKQSWAIPDIIAGIMFIRAAVTFWDERPSRT